MLYRSNSPKRSGLTLLELLTVLVILVALAGILVPMISNIQTQSRYSTTGTNLQEVASLVSSYQARYSKYPDGWDTLTVNNALATYLPGNATATGVLSNYLTTVTVTGGDATTTTLSNAGTATMYPFVATPANPTFYPYGTAESTPGPTPGTSVPIIPTPVVLTTGTTATLATLLPAGVQLLNLPVAPAVPVTPTYVVFGLGSRNTLIPKTILDAPVKFSDNALTGPNFLYCRFGLVFQVTDTSGNPLPAAVMVCVIDFSNEQGISTLGNQIEKYYNSVQVSQ